MKTLVTIKNGSILWTDEKTKQTVAELTGSGKRFVGKITALVSGKRALVVPRIEIGINYIGAKLKKFKPKPVVGVKLKAAKVVRRTKRVKLAVPAPAVSAVQPVNPPPIAPPSVTSTGAPAVKA
jgi:hypothetical protein